MGEAFSMNGERRNAYRIGPHTVTHNYTVYTLHSQFTIVLAESSYDYN
jgi:hypothetical protein